MKAVEHALPFGLLEPLASAVRIRISLPEGGTTAKTLGPVRSAV
jgi:hypothetical protein